MLHGRTPIYHSPSSDPPFPPHPGILTVAVVTYPFNFEGRRRGNQAAEGIDGLRESVDSVIVIPNDRLLDVASEGTALQDAFGLADDVLRQGVQVRTIRGRHFVYNYRSWGDGWQRGLVGVVGR